MFENQTEELIKQRMLAESPDGINTGEGDFFNDAVSPAAIELTLAYQQLDKVLELGFADTSYGEYLDKITSEKGVNRKAATKGAGLIEVTAAVGSQISIGDVLATWEGNIRFVATEAKVIGETGKASISFENEAAGNLGNVLANTLFIAPIAIPGFISAINPAQINAGTEAETEDSLRSRYFEAVRLPATSGNKYHYLKWAKEISGVGDAKVFPPTDGSHNVGVMIIDSNMQPASQALVTAVQEYIDPGARGLGEGQAPIGAFCTVTPAETLNINVSAVVTGVSPAAVTPIFESALIGYLKSIAFVAGSISYAQIMSLLLDSISKAGGTDCQNLLVNNGVSNIQIGERKVAIKGTVTLT
jgi:uncharacterized phage protein gp47/JayE